MKCCLQLFTTANKNVQWQSKADEVENIIIKSAEAVHTTQAYIMITTDTTKHSSIKLFILINNILLFV